MNAPKSRVGDKQNDENENGNEKMANGNGNGNGNGGPWWVRLLIGQTPAVVFMFAALAGGWKFLDVYLADQKATRAEMSQFLRTQTEAVNALVNSASVERAFEREVVDVHEEHGSALTAVLVELKRANAMMEPVPALRREELELLKDIRDGVSSRVEQ